MSNRLNFRLPNLSSIEPESAIEMSELPSNLEGVRVPEEGISMSSDAGGIPEILTPQQEVDKTFISRNRDVMRDIPASQDISGTLSKIGLGSGNPLLMGVGAGLAVGSAVQGSSLDEHGIIKDKLKFGIGALANPISAISTIAGQKGRKETVQRETNRELLSKKAETQVAGNRITNSIPKYTAPSYGRNGIKLTKFTK